jgi:hypothetical protein
MVDSSWFIVVAHEPLTMSYEQVFFLLAANT